MLIFIMTFLGYKFHIYFYIYNLKRFSFDPYPINLFYRTPKYGKMNFDIIFLININ